MKNPKKLSALSSVRFVAAAIIVIHHSRGLFGLPETFPFPAGACSFIFFILSGFILTYVYPDFESFQSIKAFWAARFARIWPAHVVVLICLELLFRFTNNAQYITIIDWLPIRISNIFLIHSFIPYREFYFSYNAVSWAISTELAMYFLFPFLVKNFSKTWHYKLLGSFSIALGMILICNYFNLPYYSEDPWILSIHGLVYINPLARIFEFILGMTFCLIYKRLNGISKIQLSVGTTIELAAISIVFLNLLKASTLILWLTTRLPWLGEAGQIYLSLSSISCFSFALLILVMSLELGLISKFMSLPFLVFLGEISYAIYLIHQIILRFYTINIDAFKGISNGFLIFGFIFLLIFSSYLLWKYVEQPCRHKLKSLIGVVGT